MVIGGERDPVSQGSRLRDLAQAMTRAGVRDVQLKIYPDARHELFNESNRDEVTRNLIDWLAVLCPVPQVEKTEEPL